MTVMHLVYAGYGTGRWTLRTPFDASRLCDQPPGISGTELQLFGHARELARLGHDVTVYSRFLFDATFGGVRYWELDAPQVQMPDLCLAYHDGRPLDTMRGRTKAVMHQTFWVSNRQQDATYTGADFADIYLSATERYARHLEKAYGWPKVGVVPNAWDFGTFPEKRSPVPGRMVFTTSADRGAHRLLEALPHIKAHVPEAHVICLNRGSPTATAALKASGVEVVGPLSRNETLALLSTASCLAYPCDPPSPCEVFPVSLLEACAMGIPVVLAPDDGIEEVFGPGVELSVGVKAHPLAWLSDFVGRTVRVLTDPGHAEQLSEKGRAWAQGYTFGATTQALLKECGL